MVDEREREESVEDLKNDLSISHSTFNYLQIFFNVYEPLYADCVLMEKRSFNACLLDDLNILHNILSDTKITDNLNKSLYFVSILKTFSNFTEKKWQRKIVSALKRSCHQYY